MGLVSSSMYQIDYNPKMLQSHHSRSAFATTLTPSRLTSKPSPRAMSMNLSPLSTGIPGILNSVPNAIYLGAGFTLLAGYHIRLFQLEKQSKEAVTWRTVQANTRALWSQHVRETEGWLYAVQTLRNAITANTFLATTVLSLLTVIGGRMWDILRKSSNDQLLMAQFAAVSACMLSSAYHFLQSARVMTHAGFMFPVATGTKVDRLMVKSQNAQWLGLRWLYVSLAMIAWTVGGEKLFFGSSLALVRFLFSVDRAPANIED